MRWFHRDSMFYFSDRWLNIHVFIFFKRNCLSLSLSLSPIFNLTEKNKKVWSPKLSPSLFPSLLPCLSLHLFLLLSNFIQAFFLSFLLFSLFSLNSPVSADFPSNTAWWFCLQIYEFLLRIPCCCFLPHAEKRLQKSVEELHTEAF